jgi:ATP-grasp domain/Succinyl-CoA ligase like flavodoxin domain
MDVSEVMEYLVEDAATSVIALYIESVRRPERFRRAAEQAARRGVPLVVFKVGRSEAGVQSATSHTGAMAGADRVYDALFEHTGAIRVATFGEMIDVSATLASGKCLAGRHLAILTSTGGGGALVADACGLRGFEVPPPDPTTVTRVSPRALNIVSRLNRAGVPAFDTPEGCAAGLAALCRDRRPGPLLLEPPPGRRGRDLPGGRWDEVASKALFAEYGIPSAREYLVSTPDEAARAARELGGRVVLKIRGVAHKTDVGGVQTGLRPDEVAACCEAMPGPSGWVVQEHITHGVEMLLGLMRDAQLGMAIMLGAGGIATEVFGDTTLRLLPLRDGDAQDMLGRLKVSVVLNGFRGQPRAAVPALLQAIENFARFAEDLSERLLEAEINPLFVLPHGQGVRAADGEPGARPPFSPEGPIWSPKFFFDPILRDRARSLPGVRVRFQCRLEAFSQFRADLLAHCIHGRALMYWIIRPGGRAPHAWLADGRSTLDLFGLGFVLLSFGQDASGLAEAARARGVPFAVKRIPDSIVADLYERRLVLVCPDGHVCWRADDPPIDRAALLARVVGA